MALYTGTEVVYITRMAHVLGQKCMHKQMLEVYACVQ